MVPSVLYICPTEDLDEDEEIDSVLTTGWEFPPQCGAKVLIIPERDGQKLRQIRWIYTVTAFTETGDRDWPWDLEVKSQQVVTPRRWYDLVEAVLYNGLVPIVGSHGEGDRITHKPTIELIYEMLGES